MKNLDVPVAENISKMGSTFLFKVHGSEIILSIRKLVRESL
ncbi:MAG TPA: hypothetical protein VIH27_00675 [Nitrososphaerales archaeon]